MEPSLAQGALARRHLHRRAYEIGDIVPYHFTSWIIVTSYLVSLIGSVATVELLHRRRSSRDWYSRLHLALCAVCFGLVSIWCMHFVGNKSIILGDGSPEIQLYYSAGWTTLSAILPILVLYGAFFLTDLLNKSPRAMYLALAATGVLAGLAVTGMHYIGNLGTSNYVLDNNYAHILGAASIAIVACWFSFTVFFHQKEHWINFWWRRFLCAILLAAAVSGMHWTASVGTEYRLKAYHTGNSDERNINVILAAVLCMIALVSCFGIFYWSNIRRKKVAEQAQQVVLAAFIRDESGKVLVTPEGLLPSQKITRKFNQRSFGDDLNTAHPVFQWMYRVSRNWPGIADLVPAMRAHLQAIGMIKGSSRPDTAGLSSTWDDSDTDDNYSAIFRSQFCVAAEELAAQLALPLYALGTLHDQMMMTGTTNTEPSTRSVKSSDASDHGDLEAGELTPLWGKGQVMFITRQINDDEAQRLSNNGFRFAQLASLPGKAPSKVLDIMAHSMQVKRSDLIATISGLCRTSVTSSSTTDVHIHHGSQLMANTHYVGVFAIRPGFKTSGCRWEILVHRDGHNMIPTYPISTNDNSEIYEQLSAIEVNARDAPELYRAQMANTNNTWSRRHYFALLLEAIDVLSSRLPHAIMDMAVFSGTPIKVPVAKTEHGAPAYATLWAFTVIPDVHNSSLMGRAGDTWAWIPFNFFQCLQRIGENSPDHAILARKNHIEFAQLFARTLKDPGQGSNAMNSASDHRHQPFLAGRNSTSSRGKFNMIRHWRSGIPAANIPESGIVHSDNSSEKALVETSHRERDELASQKESGLSLGGIMVSQDIVVDSGMKVGAGIELQDFGVKSVAGIALDEQPTWVDRLFGLLTAKWSKLGMREAHGRL